MLKQPETNECIRPNGMHKAAGDACPLQGSRAYSKESDHYHT